MHAVGWICIYVIIQFLSVAYAAGDDICTTTEKCICIKEISSGNLEFQCPVDLQENKTIIHVFSDAQKMRIDCHSIEEFNNTLLPEANVNMVTKIEFQECPLPMKGFTDVVKSFALYNLKSLRFSNHALRRPLTSEDLEELKNLEILELENNNMSSLDGNIFRNTPKLSDLLIERNELILNENMFGNIPNLLKLSININSINSLPKSTFKSLPKLQSISLRENNLRVLENGIFDSLTNLKMLELSVNKIEIIEDQVFRHTKNLLTINLMRNKLKNISRRIFENCHNIQLIRLDENSNVTLVDDVFSHFLRLNKVILAKNNLEQISETLFEGSTNLSVISLSHNRLRKLSAKTFYDLRSLKELRLDSNLIENMNPEIFVSLENLEYLHLQHNNLDFIDEKLLERLINLKEINLSFNNIARLHPNCLSRMKHLTTFLMSHNKFDFDETTYFGSISFTNLKEVDLSYNNITRYPYKLNDIATIETIKLQHNYIKEIIMDYLVNINTIPLDVDLRFNNISSIQLRQLNETHSSITNIEIDGNPVYCDCHTISLARYLQENNNAVKHNLVLNYKKLECAGPQTLLHQSLEEVDLKELTCTLDKNCTQGQTCDCIYRPLDKTMVVDCSNRNLTEIPELNDLSDYPEIYEFVDFNQTEVHLQDNQLVRCPGELDGYQNTTRWNLKGNAIRDIKWIPNSLIMLDLRGNELETLDAVAVKMLNESKLNNLYLGNNPWKCDCDLKDFLVYLRSHIKQVDSSDITCNATEQRLVNLSEKDFCPTESEVVLIITVVLLLCLFMITAAISLYFLYQKEILIWLYGRNYCLCLIKEEEMDKDKIYDAFISFSNKDEDFVVENLVSVLESGKQSYKLCIHFRDWIPGELIQTQIIHSVRDSRRTIVILSPNFLDSVWGIVEFKTAHNEAMREGRARVIIIIYGDIDIESLDDDLKAYLKTNTYIKWNDPWFWDKLKYALPIHHGRPGLSKKHANMMQYIENKFKLIDKQPKYGSTPIILNPSDLEEKPLTCIA